MMSNNYIKTTLKYFNSQKTFFIVNLIGLTTGLAVCYFAFLYVKFELSYDSFHENAENIYRLVTDVKTSNGTDYRGTSAPIGPAIQEAFPEVESATRFLLDYLIIQNEKGVTSEEKIAYADSTLFSVFTFPLTNGNPSRALNAPFNVVLSETCAAKYFGTDNPIGKTLLINGKDKIYITGVMKDMPYNSHFRVEMLVSLSTLLNMWNPSMKNNWKSLRFNTYLLLHNNADPNSLNHKIEGLIRDHIEKKETKYITSIEPLNWVYLHGKPRGHRAGSVVTGNINNIYIFSLVAFFVLIIASMNFINLSTAFSIRRAKETGVRKVLGASRMGLVLQFMTDSVLLSIIAFFFSLGLIIFLLPFFNQISGKVISFGVFEHPNYLGILFVISIIIGILSGIYPAFYLSGFQPISSLKGRFDFSKEGIRLRKILVTSQFLISYILIVATIVVFRQLHFMQNKELGFRKDHMIAIDFQFDSRASSEFTKRQMKNLPGVSSVSTSSSLPGKPSHTLKTKIENVVGEFEESYFDAYFADYNFIEQYDIKVIAGRPFSNQYTTDLKNSMIINEAAVKHLGYDNPNDVLGKPYAQLGRDGIIIGVIKNFHFHSFRDEVRPLTFQIGGILTFMTLSVSESSLPATLSMIEDKWKEIIPDVPLTYFFTDDAYNSQYDSERRFGQLCIVFVTIAIILACLGLFGLSTFNMMQRTKEIGIRKFLGSSALNIAMLFTKEFFFLIAIAFLPGIPLAWLAMNQWLQDFAYRVDLSFWIFILAGIILSLIAFMTIFTQTIRTANTDPVKSLKSE